MASLATQRSSTGKGPSDVSDPQTPPKKRHVMTAGEERKQGFINMVAGMIITLAIVYLLYTASGFFPKSTFLDGEAGEVETSDRYDDSHAKYDEFRDGGEHAHDNE